MKENNDGNDTNVGSMEISIEENIEILEKFKNNEMQRDKLERDGRCGGWKIGDIYKCLELDNAIDNILSDYKRVLKENEEKTTILLAGAEKVKQLEKENRKLKEDRNNNNEMVALARNEVLNYMTGYEDGKKHKMTATAQVVENQQYYIIQKQMEKYEEHIKRLRKENEEKDKQIKRALDLIFEYGQIDGGHHKAWVIDQIVRILIKDKYDEWVKNYIYDEETGDTYTWDKGIVP